MKGSKVQVREELAEAGENLQYGLVDLDFGGLVQTATECQTCSCTALISTFSGRLEKRGRSKLTRSGCKQQNGGLMMWTSASPIQTGTSEPVLAR